MSVSDGQNVNAAVTNAAFMSRLVDTSTVGIITLSAPVSPSGASVSDVQLAINQIFDAVGMTGVGDATRNDYSSNNIVTNGDDRKEAIGKLDAEFNETTGHNHDGTAGQGQPIAASAITYDNATSGLTATDGQAAIDELDASLDLVAGWTKFTVAHTALQAAALTNDIELTSLVALGTIHKVIIKHTTAFAGTGITAYSVSVGITGTLDKYAIDFDVFQAVSDTTFDTNESFGMENFGAATSIRIAATAVGANLDQSSAGSVDIYVLSSTLPT